MLTEQQLAVLRSEPGSNRVAKAMALDRSHAGDRREGARTDAALRQRCRPRAVSHHYRRVPSRTPGSSPPTSVAVSRICSRDPADRRIERGRTLEAPAPRPSGVSRRRPRPGPAGQTARNPLGSNPGASLPSPSTCSIVVREAGLHGMAIDAGRGRGRCRGLAAGIGISLRTRERSGRSAATLVGTVVGMVAALLAGLIPSCPIGSFLVLAVGLVDGLGTSLACAGIGRPASRH